MTTLRIDYLGAGMAFAASALGTEHEVRGHRPGRPSQPDDISVATPPDVVVHPAVERTDSGVLGVCALGALLPDHVLLAPGLRAGPANAMMLRHVTQGNCHPKVLFHRLDVGVRTPSDLLDAVEVAVEKPPDVTCLDPLPPGLVLDADLGEIMVSRERFARLLYVAAVRRDWCGWADLTRLLNVGDGVVRNVNGELGTVLREAGIVPWELRWTAPAFSRFVVEYRSFIVCFGQHHLGYEPPPPVLWQDYCGSAPAGNGAGSGGIR